MTSAPAKSCRASACSTRRSSYERELGLNFWDKECPTVDSISVTVPAPDGSGNKAIEWNGMLDKPAQAVDQRVKFPRWMQELEKRGGTHRVQGRHPCRPRKIRRSIRPRHRRRRQGRHRPPVRARRAEEPVRCTTARTGADLCQGADSAAARIPRSHSTHSRRWGIFRVPVADHHRPLRDHGARRRSRRPDGLLGRRHIARSAFGEIEVDSRHFPAVGS